MNGDKFFLIIILVAVVKYLLIIFFLLIMYWRIKNFNMVDFINGFRLNQEKIKDFKGKQ